MTIPGREAAVELRHLRSFLVLTESATLTEAAATLGISQPSLSAQLTFLEKHLGVRLFDRDRNGPRITVDGRRLRALVLDPVVALNSGLLEFGAEGLPVQVVAPPDLGPGLHEAARNVLNGRFPGRPVQWRELASRERVAAFRARTAQVVVDWEPIDGATGITLLGRPLGVLMSASSSLTSLDAVVGDDLAGHPVATLAGADLLRSGTSLSALIANGWTSRSGAATIDGLDDLAADPRLVMVTPEPEQADPRFTWRPLVVPVAESAWLVVC
ncbi:LysR family transcriptional regulator [Raineyella sp. LH-20]|uniref:LysR family transcriptional regulator n=1 Tax=Raineyella sp. LH-20 TaxID=3081204 RepID=UPI00295304EF|nr:LysR family transcriptional regulator [Raineyella sp. LH-20]WOP19527.1 LysR family transcriptional regulator [Raineyella sp. LH-20]